MNLTFQLLVVFLPLVTAIITTFLTSLFTIYRERKSNNYSNRIFFEYQEFELKYPIEYSKTHGEGRVLLGHNGRKLSSYVECHGSTVYSFTILKNISKKIAINVKIKHAISGRIKNNEDKNSKEIITEEFVLPVWKWEETLFIPATLLEESGNFVTNEEIIITYNTPALEKLEHSLIRQKDGTYNERLKKRYFGFIWITLLKYDRSKFYSFDIVKKDDNNQVGVK